MLATQFFITLLICILLYLVNKSNLTIIYKKFIFFIIFIEFLTMFLFFTNKFYIIFSLVLVVVSFYFLLVKYESKIESLSIDIEKSVVEIYFGQIKTKFTTIGLLLLLSLIIYEIIQGDSYVSLLFYVTFIVSITWIVYNYIPDTYSFERDFFFIFANVLFFLIVLPYLIYKANLGLVSSYNPFWYSSPELVSILLAKPLTASLNLLGYNFYYDIDIIYFQDLKAGRTRGVLVGEGCSGLHSISIFLAAFISYTLTKSKTIKKKQIMVLLLGLLVAYISNLLRMSLIILAGHYYGIEALFWAHKNLGSIIFFLWISIFWSFIEKYNLISVNFKSN